jgi:hypothetical protein
VPVVLPTPPGLGAELSSAVARPLSRRSNENLNVQPYLSIVVATRNDDHGGDPLKRLQAFVNSFDEQCRRTGLDAEVIVVEWNPPADRPRVSSLLRLPTTPTCTYRFFDVPPELHSLLQFADVLPLFQMIAKNVGIRRARGTFVLVTNIDIMFSNELVEHLALRQLQPGFLYRVDRHDIQPNVPIDGHLEEQMAYCASHQLRVHTPWGSHPVDLKGDAVCQPEDIVDGVGVQLGSGWHVRESAGPGRTFRWASESVTLHIPAAAAGHSGESVVHLDVESNPYDASSWVEIAATEGGKTLRTARIAGRVRLAVALGAPRAEPREIELRVVKPHPDWRKQLPIFERRGAMYYRVYSATASEAGDRPAFEYPVELFTNANPSSTLTMTMTAEGVAVLSDRRKFSYCVRYGPLRAQRPGLYHFDLGYSTLEGRIGVGILSHGDRFWMPATVTPVDDAGEQHLEIAVDLPPNAECSLVVFNDHPEGDHPSRFVIHQLRGTCDPAQSIAERRPTTRPLSEVQAVTYANLASRARAMRNANLLSVWKRGAADRLAQFIVRLVGNAVRYRIACSAPEYQNLVRALGAADEQVRRLAPLQDLAEVHRFLRDHRPDNLHVNGCGDFQLMAREHWDELRGYPEFETFSMNIDGLFSYIADAAGIREEVLPMPIFHLEHEIGSGWSPEGEATLRQRIAERGITWVDASTVYVWAAYMRWLGRPMIFNGSDWGFAGASLVEHRIASACDAMP